MFRVGENNHPARLNIYGQSLRVTMRKDRLPPPYFITRARQALTQLLLFNNQLLNFMDGLSNAEILIACQNAVHRLKVSMPTHLVHGESF